MKGKTTAPRLTRCLYGGFAAVFGWLLCCVLFYNPHFPHLRAGWVLLAAAVWLAVFAGLWLLVRRFAAVLQQREGWVLLGYFVLLAATMGIFYWQIAAYPSRDLERVYTAAVNFAVNGFIEEPYLTYFYRFPNNMPLVIVLQFIFRGMNRLGLARFYLGGTVLNAGAIMLAHLFVYLCAKRFLGRGRAFYALAVLYLCIPLQCLVTQFYTDTLTMPFAPFALYCTLRLREAASLRGRLLAAGVLCAGLAFGVKLKYSVVIVLVAILLDMLLRREWKQLLVLPAFLIVYVGVSAGFDGYMYAHFLDKETAQDMATPFSAWVMMGLAGDGGHNAADNYLVWEAGGAAEMKQAANEELVRRFTGYKPGEFLAFLNQKALRSFGSGNLDTARTVANSPLRQTFVVECVSPGGRYYTGYETVVRGYYVALLALAVAGAVLALRRRCEALRPVYIALVGLLLFLLLWEADNRYLINYFTFFVLAAATAANRLGEALHAKRRA